MNRPSLLFFLLTACMLTPDLDAQCTVVAGTGCPGALAPVCTGSSQLGQSITVQCPSATIGLGVLAIGFPAASSIPIGSLVTLPTCSGQFCSVDVDLPSAVMTPGLVDVTIPSNPALTGLVVRSQCLEALIAATVGGCVNVTAATEFQVL